MVQVAQETLKTPTTILDYKEFERAFNAARRANNQERTTAQGTLSPAAIERGIRTGKGVQVNEAGGGPGHYTPQQLKIFRTMMKRVQNEFSSGKSGALVKQLIALSRKIDIKRANEEIPYSRLYQVRGNMLKFSVKASGRNDFDGHYQVRIRLEGWDAAMISGKSFRLAARDAANGRVSIDCQCGRHQYWYRYLAGVGNFDVNPPKEKDFPKIRNPSMEGACCKHILKTLITLQSPTVQNVLAKEMERQSAAVGFSPTNSRFITKSEHQVLSRARPREINQTSAAAAYKDYLKAAKGMKNKAGSKVSLEEENRMLKAKSNAQAAQLKRMNRTAEIHKLSAELSQARMDAVMKAASTGSDPQQALPRATADFTRQYADKTGQSVETVAAMIKEAGL